MRKHGGHCFLLSLKEAEEEQELEPQGECMNVSVQVWDFQKVRL